MEIIDKDPHNLQRFLDAQALVYEQVLDELVDGHKQTHWVWYIFPQRKGLGKSANSEYYGIGSDDEARAYLKHPELGHRLRTCVLLVRNHLISGASLEDVLGEIDARKFRSCMQLFGEVSGEEFFSDLA